MFMYHDASTAVLLDLRRRFKAVGDLLHALIRDEVTLTRSLELTVQWDGIIRIGPVSPLTVQDFEMARSGGLRVWLQVVEGLHRGLSDFIHWVVVHRVVSLVIFITGSVISLIVLLFTVGRKLSWGGGIG